MEENNIPGPRGDDASPSRLRQQTCLECPGKVSRPLREAAPRLGSRTCWAAVYLSLLEY